MWRKSWMMTQQWQDILFLHWPVPPHELKQHIPNELELDLYENKAWLSIVLFKVTGNRLRFMPPFPGVSSFLQLNVRTYVTYNGMKGIHFFNLDVNNAFLVKLTPIDHFLPFRHAKMSLKRKGNTFTFTSSVQKSKTLQEKLVATFKPSARQIESLTFERWLVERYHLWKKTDKHLLRMDVLHSPWCLQHVSTFINVNTMTSFVKNSTLLNQPIAHYAKSKKTLIFPPVLVMKNSRNL